MISNAVNSTIINPVSQGVEEWRDTFTPEQYNPIIWLDASDRPTISTITGGYVDEWMDKSNYNNSVIQLSGAYQPSFAQGYTETSEQLLTNSEFDTDTSGWVSDSNVTTVVGSGIVTIGVSVATGIADQVFCYEEIYPSGTYNVQALVTDAIGLFRIALVDSVTGDIYTSDIISDAGYISSYIEVPNPFTVCVRSAMANTSHYISIDYIRLYNVITDNRKNSLIFDGVDDYLVGDPLKISGETTVAININSDVQINSYPVLFITKPSISASTGFYVSFFSTNTNRIEIRGSGPTSVNFILNTDTLNTDTVLCFIFSESLVKVYQDGIFVNSGPIETIVEPVANTLLGKSPAGSAYKGKVSKFVVVNRALSESEIAQLTDYLA